MPAGKLVTDCIMLVWALPPASTLVHQTTGPSFCSFCCGNTRFAEKLYKHALVSLLLVQGLSGTEKSHLLRVCKKQKQVWAPTRSHSAFHLFHLVFCFFFERCSVRTKASRFRHSSLACRGLTKCLPASGLARYWVVQILRAVCPTFDSPAVCEEGWNPETLTHDGCVQDVLWKQRNPKLQVPTCHSCEAPVLQLLLV